MSIFSFNHKVFDFKNVKNINFNHIGDGIFQITINADIKGDDNIIEDGTFKAGKCRIDSNLSLYRDIENILTTNMGITYLKSNEDESYCTIFK